MAHEIDMSNGRANMAFVGSRKDIWHGLGQVILESDTPEQCAAKAGLEWRAVKCPAAENLDGTPIFGQSVK